MHRQRPTSTRSAKGRKKGYKLKGLTKAEGTRRAQQAWITKHHRYRYGAKPLPVVDHDALERRRREHREQRSGMIDIEPGQDVHGNTSHFHGITDLHEAVIENANAANATTEEDLAWIREASTSQKEELRAWSGFKGETDDEVALIQAVKQRMEGGNVTGEQQRKLGNLQGTDRARAIAMQKRINERKAARALKDPVIVAQEREAAYLETLHPQVREFLGRYARTKPGSLEREDVMNSLSEDYRGQVFGPRGVIAKFDSIRKEVVHAPEHAEDPYTKPIGARTEQRSTRLRALVGKEAATEGEIFLHAGPRRTPPTVASVQETLMGSPMIKEALKDAPARVPHSVEGPHGPKGPMEHREDGPGSKADIRQRVADIAEETAKSHSAKTATERAKARKRAIKLTQDLGTLTDQLKERSHEKKQNLRAHNQIKPFVGDGGSGKGGGGIRLDTGEPGPSRRSPARPPLVDPNRRVRDPRLERITVEEAYRLSGHEDIPALRAKGIKVNTGIKGIFSYAPPRPNDQRKKLDQIVSRMGGQVGFVAKAQKKRFDAARSGTIEMGWDAQGKRVAPTKAVFGLGPNKAWEYTLNKLDPHDKTKVLREEKKQRIAYGDTKEYHHRGKYYRGYLQEGEWDEVAKVDLVDKFRGRTGSILSAQKLHKHEWERVDTEKAHHRPGFDPDSIVEREFVAVPGLTKISTKDVNTTKGLSAKVADTRRIPATDIGVTVGVRDNVSLPTGVKRIYYVPPHMLHSEKTSEVGVVIPGIKKFNVGDRLAFANVDESTTSELKLPGLGVGPDIPVGRILLANARQNQIGYRDQASRAAAQHPDFGSRRPPKNGDYAGIDPKEEKGGEHLKTVGAAGVAAAYYTGQRKVRRGAAPMAINRFFNKVAAKHPRIASLRDKYHIPEEAVPVKEHLRAPGAVVTDMAATWKLRVAHPLSGDTAFGIETGKFFNREHYISSPEQSRLFAKRGRIELQRVASTKDYLEKNIYSKKRSAKRIAKYRQNVMNHPDYADFPKAIDKYEEGLHNILGQPELAGKAHKEAQKGLQTVAELRKTHKPQEQAVLHWGPSDPHAGLVTKAEGDAMVRAAAGKATHEVGFLARNKTPLIVSGALVGTTIGAHYLYHKHQESKKAPEDRTAYYNKILPKSFETPPIPSAKVGFWHSPNHPVLRELLLANKPLVPTSVKVTTRRRRVALRPSERGYDPNLPLVGRPKLLKGKGAKGGSFAESVMFHTDAPRSRYYTPNYKNVYIKGKKTPIVVSRGKSEAPKLSSYNPRKLTTEDREKLAYLFGPKTVMSTEDAIMQKHIQDSLRHTVGGDPKLMQLMDDPKKLREVRKKHGTAMEKRFLDGMEASRKERAARVTEQIELAKAKEQRLNAAPISRIRSKISQIEQTGLGKGPLEDNSPSFAAGMSIPVWWANQDAKSEAFKKQVVEEGKKRRAKRGWEVAARAERKREDWYLAQKGDKPIIPYTAPTRAPDKTLGFDRRGGSRTTNRATNMLLVGTQEPRPVPTVKSTVTAKPIEKVYGYDIKVGTRRTGEKVIPSQKDQARGMKPFEQEVMDISATRIARQPKSNEDTFQETINHYRGPRKARIRKKK